MKTIRHQIFRLITIIFLLFQLFSPIWVYIPTSGAVVLSLYVGFTIALFPILLKNRTFIFLSIYTLITFIYFLIGNAFYDSLNSVIIPFLTVVSSLLLIGYIMLYPDSTFIKTIIYITFLLLVIVSIISIPQVHHNPNIIRGASIYGAQSGSESVYYWIIGYGVIHGITVIFAPLVVLVKRGFKIHVLSSLIWFAVLLLLLYIIYLSNASTAFIISILTILGSLFFNFDNLSRKNIFKTMSICIVVLLLFNKVTVISFLDMFQPMFNENGGNYSKISDLRDYFIYGEAEGGIETRELLYNASLKLFCESPFIGTLSPEKIGKHSYFLDRLASLGIFFIIPLFLTFVTHIRSVFSKLNRMKVVYLVGCLSYIIMLFLKNDFGIGTFLFAFAILPIYCLYLENILYNRNVSLNGIKSNYKKS